MDSLRNLINRVITDGLLGREIKRSPKIAVPVQYIRSGSSHRRDHLLHERSQCCHAEHCGVQQLDEGGGQHHYQHRRHHHRHHHHHHYQHRHHYHPNHLSHYFQHQSKCISIKFVVGRLDYIAHARLLFWFVGSHIAFELVCASRVELS